MLLLSSGWNMLIFRTEKSKKMGRIFWKACQICWKYSSSNLFCCVCHWLFLTELVSPSGIMHFTTGIYLNLPDQETKLIQTHASQADEVIIFFLGASQLFLFREKNWICLVSQISTWIWLCVFHSVVSRKTECGKGNKFGGCDCLIERYGRIVTKCGWQIIRTLNK